MKLTYKNHGLEIFRTDDVQFDFVPIIEECPYLTINPRGLRCEIHLYFVIVIV